MTDGPTSFSSYFVAKVVMIRPVGPTLLAASPRVTTTCTFALGGTAKGTLTLICHSPGYPPPHADATEPLSIIWPGGLKITVGCRCVCEKPVGAAPSAGAGSGPPSQTPAPVR